MTNNNTFAEALRQQPFDSNKRWYDQWLDVVHQANDLIIENTELRQRIHQLERELQAAQLTPGAAAQRRREEMR
jgi:cell division septum initiation protein DivIVA